VNTPQSFFTYTFNTLFLAVHVYTPRSFCTFIHLIHYSWLFMCTIPSHSLHIYIHYIISSCSCVHSPVILYINTFIKLYLAVNVYTPRSFCTLIHLIHYSRLFMCTLPGHFLHIHSIHYSWLFMCTLPGHSLHIHSIHYS